MRLPEEGHSIFDQLDPNRAFEVVVVEAKGLATKEAVTAACRSGLKTPWETAATASKIQQQAAMLSAGVKVLSWRPAACPLVSLQRMVQAVFCPLCMILTLLAACGKLQ